MTPTGVPPSTMDAAALHAALEHVLSAYFGRKRSVRDLERRRSPYSSSFLIEELDVTLDDHSRLEMICKDMSPGAVPESARWVKPAFLYHAAREVEMYRTVLGRLQLGTATYYGSVVSRRMKRCWLFLERVPGVPLWQVGEFEVWREAARRLAVVHLRLRRELERLQPGRNAAWLRYDEAYYRRWMRRAAHFVRRKDPASMDTLGGLIRRYGRLMNRLAALPAGLIHGEFYPSNVLVQRSAGRIRVCPIDWETAAVGPVLMDLSALTCGVWTREQQAAMVAAYHEVLAAERVSTMGVEELLTGLEWCRLFQAVKWTGWSLRWKPPPEHARNWLHEAVVLAERLAL